MVYIFGEARKSLRLQSKKTDSFVSIPEISAGILVSNNKHNHN